MASSSSSRCSYDSTLLFVDDIIRNLHSPYIAEFKEHLSNGDLRAALSMDMPDPNGYSNSQEFANDYLVWNLLRKSDIDLGVDTVEAATTAFFDAEATCAHINTHGFGAGSITYLLRDLQPKITENSVNAKLSLAAELISDVLGPFSWDRAERGFGFSGGASTRLPRKSGSPYYKFSGVPEVTPGAKLLATCAISRVPLWRNELTTKGPNPSSENAYMGGSDPETWTKTVAGSRADTVPKTWKTGRFICIEPDLNMYLQRGVGKMIRRALKKVGINLNSQLWNQHLAWIGSRTGSLATIDLKAASDSISLYLCKVLLPADWYEAILRLRSSYTLVKGKWVKLAKVSSMGNGFTFELESLIFWALARATLTLENVADQRLAVYGDDIVIHHEAAPALIELLDYVGFETNKEKTFLSGPFRESCGKHYFYGADVSPFNIKEAVQSEDRFYWLYNSYTAWAGRITVPDKNVQRRLRRRGRCFTAGKPFCVVPPGYGAVSGIETPLSDAYARWSTRKSGWVFTALREVRKKHRPNGTSAVIWWLSLHELTQNCLDIPKGEGIYKRFTRCTSRWAA